jgi:hypothetical protein
MTMKRLAVAALLALPLAALAYDVNGVKLGGREADVKRAFPSVHCKPLEWKTDAADRRCDDAQISLEGVPTRFTAFLKADSIQAFDLRCDIKDLERVKAVLRTRWGAPLAEVTDTIAQKDKKDRKVFKMRWEKGADLAILSAQLEKKRVTVEVSRGNFAAEIYRIR